MAAPCGLASGLLDIALTKIPRPPASSAAALMITACTSVRRAVTEEPVLGRHIDRRYGLQVSLERVWSGVDVEQRRRRGRPDARASTGRHRPAAAAMHRQPFRTPSALALRKTCRKRDSSPDTPACRRDRRTTCQYAVDQQRFSLRPDAARRSRSGAPGLHQHRRPPERLLRGQTSGSAGFVGGGRGLRSGFLSSRPAVDCKRERKCKKAQQPGRQLEVDL